MSYHGAVEMESTVTPDGPLGQNGPPRPNLIELLRSVKVVIEKHPEGYVAHPLGLLGVVMGHGDTFEEALLDIRSAIRSHLEIHGRGAYPENGSPILEAFIAEVNVVV